MGAKKMKIKIVKAFLEVKHNQNIKISERMNQLYTIIKMNITLFPSNNMDLENNKLILENTKKGYKCIIESNRIIFDYDDVSSLNAFKYTCIEVVNSILSELKVDRITRLGFRTLSGIEYPTYHAASETIKKRFLSIPKGLLLNLGENQTGFQVRFTSELDKYKANYSIYPVTFEDVQVKINEVVKKASKHLSLFDMDFYNDNLVESNEVEAFIKTGIIQVESKSSYFIDMMKGD